MVVVLAPMLAHAEVKAASVGEIAAVAARTAASVAAVALKNAVPEVAMSMPACMT